MKNNPNTAGVLIRRELEDGHHVDVQFSCDTNVSKLAAFSPNETFVLAAGNDPRRTTAEVRRSLSGKFSVHHNFPKPKPEGRSPNETLSRPREEQQPFNPVVELPRWFPGERNRKLAHEIWARQTQAVDLRWLNEDAARLTRTTPKNVKRLRFRRVDYTYPLPSGDMKRRTQFAECGPPPEETLRRFPLFRPDIATGLSLQLRRHPRSSRSKSAAGIRIQMDSTPEFRSLSQFSASRLAREVAAREIELGEILAKWQEVKLQRYTTRVERNRITELRAKMSRSQRRADSAEVRELTQKEREFEESIQGRVESEEGTEWIHLLSLEQRELLESLRFSEYLRKRATELTGKLADSELDDTLLVLHDQTASPKHKTNITGRWIEDAFVRNRGRWERLAVPDWERNTEEVRMTSRKKKNESATEPEAEEPTTWRTVVINNREVLLTEDDRLQATTQRSNGRFAEIAAVCESLLLLRRDKSEVQKRFGAKTWTKKTTRRTAPEERLGPQNAVWSLRTAAEACGTVQRTEEKKKECEYGPIRVLITVTNGKDKTEMRFDCATYGQTLHVFRIGFVPGKEYQPDFTSLGGDLSAGVRDFLSAMGVGPDLLAAVELAALTKLRTSYLTWLDHTQRFLI